VLIVRENVGGLYGGAFGRRDGGRVAFQECAYDGRQVDRIVDVAATLAARRSGRLAVVVKRGGIPEVSALWCERAERIADRCGVALDVLDVDNAGFQLVAHPRRFDVVVAPNMLGDVLADVGAVLLGSRGMSYSANFGPAGRAVYQTGHGAAYDLAGTDRANPIAQILALAAMLRESFGLFDAADEVEAAVERVLGSGLRTADVAGPGSRVVGTRVLAQHVAMEVAERSSVRAEVS
jgi:3-isopropylmalate dehydrogenase